MNNHNFIPNHPQMNQIDAPQLAVRNYDPQFERMFNDPLSMPYNIQHLPIANITRIMKKSLKPKAKIAKTAKETVQECVSEFISFITCEAALRSKSDKRKTINGDDILTSMEELGFDRYAKILREYLRKYRKAWEMLDKEVKDMMEDEEKVGGATQSEIGLSILGDEKNKFGNDDISIAN